MAQLNGIINAANELNDQTLIILGDFILDKNKRYCSEYQHNNLFSIMNKCLEELKMVQMINFPTWQRVVNNELKTSTLDHLYVTDPTDIINIETNCRTREN